MQCLSLVRGYERRVRLYHERRYAAIHGSPLSMMGMPRGNNKTDDTASRVARLEEIERMFDTRVMRAVEQSKLLIGNDLPEELRRKLTDAIWDSCIEGRNFNFDYRWLPVGKTNFYERRREFLNNIAIYAGIS